MRLGTSALAAPSLTRWLAALVVLGATILAPVGQAHAVGLLVPTREGIDPLSVRYHRVSVSIRERIAETRVEQTFTNHTGEVLEAYYVFPVPAGASVSGFAMWVDGVRVEGELLEAGRARTVYEGIVARMRDPGLVEHIGENLFRARVYPIQPYSEQRIEITFTETLDYEGGIVHYRYPLRTPDTAARTTADCTISVDLASRTAIRAIYSPSHALSVARNGDNAATIGYEGTGVVLDRDFDLYYGVDDRDVGLSLLTHRDVGDDGYFLAMVAPRNQIADAELPAKEVLFVFDTSGSMAGDAITRARTALDAMLSRLGPNDTFQVVRFSTDVEVLFDGGASVPATPENIARARRFAARFVAAGGTAIHPALTEALRQRQATPGLPRMVVFMTDGMPTVGQTDPTTIVRDVVRLSAASAFGSTSGSRLYVFGVGNDVNTTFLDQLAQQNGGVGDYFRDGAEMEHRITVFFDRVAYPVFTDLHLSVPGASAYDVYPRDLGHLYRGDQLLVVGRYRGDGPSHVVLEGRFGHESSTRALDFEVTFPGTEGRNEFLPRVWAVRKVGTLLDDIRLNGERAELRDEVIHLARDFGIVTPYTSYLVAPDEPTVVPDVWRVEVDVDVTTGGEWSGSSVVTPSPVMPSAPPPAPRAETTRAAEDFAGFESASAPSPTDSGSYGGGGSYDYSDDDGGGGAGSYYGGATTPYGSTSSGSTSVAPTPPPVAAAPSGGTGEAGRRLSGRLRDMRDAERTDEAEGTTTRWALGRTFAWRGGGWIDPRYHEGMRELVVRAMSDAYFALLRARPDLREALSMGERVIVTLDDTRAVIVAPNAGESSSDEVTRFCE